MDGEVIRAGLQKEDDHLLCEIRLNNDDVLVIDFGEETYDWKYENFECDFCGRKFEKKKGISKHKQMEPGV